jgi:hypothetical protein
MHAQLGPYCQKVPELYPYRSGRCRACLQCRSYPYLDDAPCHPNGQRHCHEVCQGCATQHLPQPPAQRSIPICWGTPSHEAPVPPTETKTLRGTQFSALHISCTFAFPALLDFLISSSAIKPWLVLAWANSWFAPNTRLLIGWSKAVSLGERVRPYILGASSYSMQARR